VYKNIGYIKQPNGADTVVICFHLAHVTS